MAVATHDLVPPRILLVGNGLGGGGAETRFRMLAQHLLGGTADAAILTSAHAQALGAHQTVHELGWSGPRSYPAVLRRLWRVVRAKPYDVVMAFGLYPNALSWAAIAGLGGRRPALVMTEITQPHTESQLGGPFRHAVSHLVRRAIYRSADFCGANSEDGVAEIVRHYRVKANRIRRLPNLVEPDRLRALANEANGSPDDRPVICAVARLDPLKRIDTLLEAAAGLPSGLAWRIEVLGDGPDRAALEALTSRLGIADKVQFRGWTKNPYPMMARATATALTSTYEGFSNTVLESMVLGTPVITSYCSTDARLMCEAGAALGFPIGDHLALRAQLEQVLGSVSLRERLRMRSVSMNSLRVMP
jgi:glycosyltransferase involved in cell wall biosynthesis